MILYCCQLPFNICFWQSWNFQNTPKRHWPVSRLFRKYEKLFPFPHKVSSRVYALFMRLGRFKVFELTNVILKRFTVRTLRKLSCVPCTQTPVYIKYSCFAAVALAGAYANHRKMNNHSLVRHRVLSYQ